MKVSKTKLEGVLLIQPDIFEDHRGFFVETYNEQMYRDQGIDIHFVQDDFSTSSQHVLRGIHGDDRTWKLVSCPVGRLYFVVVNCNQKSEAFGQWQSFTLSENNRTQVLIPPHYGNGYLVMSDNAMFAYKQSSYYQPRGQFTYLWNDPQFGIWWPIKNPILSRRDEQGQYVD